MENSRKFASVIIVLAIVHHYVCVWGFKECTNIPTQQSSHTLRYELESSKDEAWKSLVHSHFAHLTPTDENFWATLKPSRRQDLEDAQEDFKWRMMYRRLRESNNNSLINGQNFLQEVSLHNVRVDPNSVYGAAQQTNLEYMLMLDVDNLVWSFRKTAGLPTPGKPYGGWEDPTVELRGHFVGHYMSGTALMWASTHNQTLFDKMTSLVSALATCQKAMGTGYLSAFPSELFDRFEAVQPVWAPYYTIHKIMAGLLDQYTLAGNKQALNMTMWMADYFYMRVKNVIQEWTIERHWTSLNEETGGMNDVLYQLYTISKNPNHLELAHLFDKPCFLGLLAMQADSLSGFHANTHIPVVIGSQMRYEVTGDPLYKEIGTFFIDIVNSSHAWATGGTSSGEFWENPKRLLDTLSTETEEGCTSYNLLKVIRHLFRWTRDMKYADYYERVLTNGMLGRQRGTNPGVYIYMLPQGAGVSKAHSYHGWGDWNNSFWCDYGSGVESFSKLGDSIYFEENGVNLNLYIIQFIPSTFTWDNAGFTLNQVIQPLFSHDPNLNISIEFSSFKSGKVRAEDFIVNIRIPFWTSPNAKAMLNTEALSLPSPGNFLTIKRKWESGDKVTLSLPIGLRTERIEDDRPQAVSIQAILFGPYLLAGMADNGWDLNIGKASSINDWIKPVPAIYASQLFSFHQETLVLEYNNTQVLMGKLPMLGTDEAVHSTFRVVDSSKVEKIYNSTMDFIGKNIYLELFDQPGVAIAHQGPNNPATIANTAENNAIMFKVLEGLNGKKNTISFESTCLPNCFLFGGGSTAQDIILKCKPNTTDDNFKDSVSYTGTTGISTYHPISFIASGSNRNYHLKPLYSYMDEFYTSYFNITT
ncbi:hypothetical protein SUGI_0842080 [Cryptomeria japonica]|uniref:uncharacterized protein LOC131052208 n=1 Tax=Cryptomeria japonica TaxID=3369 RepID=UPI00241483C3|nr:uncharacterized protein LOC131052208 [Cryptomeria japonica]GLJ40736.1 hypothetical protein SUGI_0842080 [Cryptomeria japonica]